MNNPTMARMICPKISARPDGMNFVSEAEASSEIQPTTRAVIKIRNFETKGIRIPLAE